MNRPAALVVFGVFLFAGVSLSAQIHGTPASVTSLGPGGFAHPPGVPASVTSLGPRGFQSFACCNPGFTFTFGHVGGVRFHAGFNRFHGGFRHRGFRGFGGFGGVPVYVPYSYVPLYDSYLEDSDQGQRPATVIIEREVPARDEAGRYGEHRYGEERTPPDTSPVPAPAQAAPAEEQEPTVLVFRDGHKLEVRNYAIVGQTLFNLDSRGARKIQLAELDVDATRKLNDDRGIEFRLPQKAL